MPVNPKGYVAGGDQRYLYEVAPVGQLVLLLTSGGICTKGIWYGPYGKYFWGWAPLPTGDRLLEEQLGLPFKFEESP